MININTRNTILTMTRRSTDSENWGGARPGAGRKVNPNTEKRKLISLNLKISLLKRIEKIEGNRTKAIEMLVDHWEKTKGK